MALLVLSAGIGSLPAAEAHFPGMTTKRLLEAKPRKWQHVELVRDYAEDGAVLSYRWLINDWARDRRGPGAYVRQTECILYAPAGNVEVIRETAVVLELVIRFTGYEQESTIRMVADRRRPLGQDANAWVRVVGKGTLYDEFAAHLNKLQEEGDDLVWEENRPEAPAGPGNLLRWFYLAEPAGKSKPAQP